MIGDEVPIGGRFIGRQYYGEIFPIYSDVKQKVSEDVIQTRILWLTGLEEGKNKEDLLILLIDTYTYMEHQKNGCWV